ncbi:unnamed protein product [Rotaria magnacalcarata]|uniref:Uncharacterized protein n=2 Tax=Rotaria magnacalcarata TaxID=392030 RepID=A0A814FE47_9BILA|nr:unnamed protein product [Rotaria magnacalcarata]CAF1210612.1 unnamed protein product [Rotaria magnacalcarata]CAF1929561.1 unnamed protein product [Rotaria magnacalcarata]
MDTRVEYPLAMTSNARSFIQFSTVHLLQAASNCIKNVVKAIIKKEHRAYAGMIRSRLLLLHGPCQVTLVVYFVLLLAQS